MIGLQNAVIEIIMNASRMSDNEMLAGTRHKPVDVERLIQIKNYSQSLEQ